MAKQWRHAVVGVGTVGDWHVRIIPQRKTSQIVAVCDVDATRAKASLEKHKQGHVPIYGDLSQMLAKHPNIDIVHVCTPSGDHFTPVTTALQARKNVICEKPL